MKTRQLATLFCSLFLIGSAEVVASPMMAQMGRSFGVPSSEIAYLPAAYGLAYGPVALLAGPEVAVDRARDVLRRADGHRGHIFNLGHGVLPDTDPDVVHRVADLVHEEGKVR